MAPLPQPTPLTAPLPPGARALARFLDGNVWYSFKHSPVAIVATLIALVCAVCALGARWIAPHNPLDLATLDLADARLPPAWVDEGSAKYLLGTDDQGRDILSALMYGSRISLFVGLASVAVSMVLGVGLGLLAVLLAAASTASSCGCAT